APAKAATPKATAKKPAAKSGSTAGTAGKKAAHTTPANRNPRPMSPRVRRIRQAFVASTTLRAMAQQLIQDRTPAGYAGVEGYAGAHAKRDGGALTGVAVAS